MPLRNPLTEGERDQARLLWVSMVTYPGFDRTHFTIASSLAVSLRQARRELAGLAEHSLVEWSQPRSCAQVDAQRKYSARRDPHAQRGFEDLFGEPMPEEWRR